MVPNPSTGGGISTPRTGASAEGPDDAGRAAAGNLSREDDIDGQVRRDLDAMAIDTVGADGPRQFAVTPAEADEALRWFIEHRLPAFGRYGTPCSAGLGDGALAAVGAAESGGAGPVGCCACRRAGLPRRCSTAGRGRGFIRQILGWREYMWQLYWHFGPAYRDRNALDAHTRCRTGGRVWTPMRSMPNACVRLWPGCAIAAGHTISSG